jgi:hypothetical protein
MKHVPLSSATFQTFVKAKINAGPLTLISNKIPDILGLEGNNRLTVDQMKDPISFIRAHVSFSAGIHIPTVLTLTIAFSRRRAVAY